ncbi:MAG: peptidoglycan editing factor PgeF [Pseudomonadota bacterium]|jgi:YfiH family protein
MSRSENALPHLAVDWPAPQRVQAYTTLRHTLESVETAKRALASALPREPSWIKQVHGTAVFDVDASADAPRAELPVADAAITTRVNTPLVASTADCLPVFFAAADASAIGVAHAGWRGLAAGVLENTAAALRAKRPHALWLAHLGPAIGPHAFEVGGDVFEAFVSQDAAAQQAFTDKGGGKYWCNLYLLAQQRLRAAGITQISGGALCTVTDSARFYSFRRDRRIIDHLRSVIWISG